MKGLRGNVVLLDFWTFDSINCIRTLPQIRQLHGRYAEDRFVLVGVHTPEFEMSPDNVAQCCEAFSNRISSGYRQRECDVELYRKYWPRQTLVDARGRVRWELAGEGDFDMMEDEIRVF